MKEQLGVSPTILLSIVLCTPHLVLDRLVSGFIKWLNVKRVLL